MNATEAVPMVTNRNNSDARPTVFIVDDDGSVRASLAALVESVGLQAETFASAREFLDGFDPARPGCLVLDVRLGEENGLDLQDELTLRGSSLPVIMVTAFGTIPATVRAMRGGAIDFLQKPVPSSLFRDRIHEALELDRANREREMRRSTLQARLGDLTPREAEVLEFIKLGRTSRDIAEQLELSPRTVEGHRQVILRKFGVNSTAQLLHLLATLEE